MPFSSARGRCHEALDINMLPISVVPFGHHTSGDQEPTRRPPIAVIHSLPSLARSIGLKEVDDEGEKIWNVKGIWPAGRGPPSLKRDVGFGCEDLAPRTQIHPWRDRHRAARGGLGGKTLDVLLITCGFNPHHVFRLHSAMFFIPYLGQQVEAWKHGRLLICAHLLDLGPSCHSARSRRCTPSALIGIPL